MVISNSRKVSKQQVVQKDMFFCSATLLAAILTDFVVCYCSSRHIPKLKSFPQPVSTYHWLYFALAIFSLHKQHLQSESALIKGTNLSRSNQVAALASAADNSGLFDQKYIIFRRLPAWVPLSEARK